MDNLIRRYNYIDIARGLGILAVVWAHIMLVGWSHRVIYSFHMPLFFFLSGMLFQKQKYQSYLIFIKKRALRLLVPYLIYAILSWILWSGFQILRGEPLESIWGPFMQIFLAKGSGMFLVFNSALWFLPCLFVVEIIYFVIAHSREWICITISVTCAAISFLLGHLLGDSYWFTPPYNLDAALIALPFYCVGNLFIKHYSHSSITSFVAAHKSVATLIWMGLTAILFVLSLSWGECSMGSSSYQCNGGIFMIRAFVGIGAMLLFSLLLDSIIEPRILIWFGKNSLDIMCLHIPIKGVIIIILASFLKTTSDIISEKFSISFVAFVITIIIITVLTLVINKLIRK